MEDTKKKTKLGVSGYRGVWGKNLDEQITYKYALAFAKIIKQKGGTKILVGRDARPTGSLMLKAVRYAIEKEGLRCEYAGIIPSPSMLLLVKKLSYDGGVIITASHNPKEYNGLKFVMGSGLFPVLGEVEEIEKIKNTLEKEEYKESAGIESESFNNAEFRKIHIGEILKNIDVELIKSKKFKVALDPINSAGSIITKELLEKLGCETFIINGKQDGEFTHMPEPRVENLGEISQAVLQSKSDIGFAEDPDADRLAVVTEKGQALSEEYTLALAIKSVLGAPAARGGAVVANLSTSNTNEDVALSLGGTFHRTKVSDMDVIEKMQEVGAVIGGEGQGGVVYPKINMAEDSLAGIGLILELLARENKKISEIADSLPKYIFIKEKTSFMGNVESIYEIIKQKFPDAKVNELDGLRLDWADRSWIHVRPSNTEPIIRIYGEAKSKDRIESLVADVISIIKS